MGAVQRELDGNHADRSRRRRRTVTLIIAAAMTLGTIAAVVAALVWAT